MLAIVNIAMDTYSAESAPHKMGKFLTDNAI